MHEIIFLFFVVATYKQTQPHATTNLILVLIMIAMGGIYVLCTVCALYTHPLTTAATTPLHSAHCDFVAIAQSTNHLKAGVVHIYILISFLLVVRLSYVKRTNETVPSKKKTNINVQVVNRFTFYLPIFILAYPLFCFATVTASRNRHFLATFDYEPELGAHSFFRCKNAPLTLYTNTATTTKWNLW